MDVAFWSGVACGVLVAVVVVYLGHRVHEIFVVDVLKMTTPQRVALSTKDSPVKVVWRGCSVLATASMFVVVMLAILWSVFSR